MEKKNTILLTVIAVATLLVAVVGATFAFFSLSAGGESTTTGTIKADAVGTATITDAQTKLTLTLKPEDMVKPETEEDKIYYAVPGATDDGNHGDSTPIAISYATYTGGTAGTSYKCPVQVKVTATGSMTTVPDDLQEGWTLLELSGDAVNKSSAESMTGVTSGEDGKLKIDLKQALTAGDNTFVNKSVVLKGEVTLAGPSVENQTILSASLSLTNKYNADQNKIAGKTLELGINVTPDGDCAVVTG